MEYRIEEDFYIILLKYFQGDVMNITLEKVKNIKNMKGMKTIKIIDKLLSDNFQKKINLITVLRYYFLKDLACNNNVGKKYFSMLIDELSEID